MRFLETSLPGAFVIELDPAEDERGYFARTFCAREFAAHGLATQFVQSSTSWTGRRGVVRGLHFQRPPAAEAKLVRCTAGAIHDVIVDLRVGSPTYLRHVAIELTSTNGHSLYVPPLFAHGYQTLSEQAEVSYQINEYYAPDQSAGLRHDDPLLGIHWPLPITLVSERDQKWPLVGGRTEDVVHEH